VTLAHRHAALWQAPLIQTTHATALLRLATARHPSAPSISKLLVVTAVQTHAFLLLLQRFHHYTRWTSLRTSRVHSTAFRHGMHKRLNSTAFRHGMHKRLNSTAFEYGMHKQRSRGINNERTNQANMATCCKALGLSANTLQAITDPGWHLHQSTAGCAVYCRHMSLECVSTGYAQFLAVHCTAQPLVLLLGTTVASGFDVSS
jgi:hypothetical protein